MYATAHLVRSHLNGREGINAFIHEHGRGFPWPRDAEVLPDNDPGALRDEIISIRPGGNHVRAYLDILAPDETSPAQLLAVLDSLPALVADTRTPSIQKYKDVTIRFGVELGLTDQQSDQLRALTTALRPLLQAWSAS